MTAVTEVLDEARLSRDAATAPPGQRRDPQARTARRGPRRDLAVRLRRRPAGPPTDLGELTAAALRARRWAGEVSAELPAGVVAEVDPRRFDLIAANLVGRALRHGAPPVEIMPADAGDSVVREVTDHGPGLPDEAGGARFVVRLPKRGTGS